MKIDEKIEVKLPSFPLPIYEAIHIADATSKDGEKFKIFVGLNGKMTLQLKTLSVDQSDTELQKNTSDLKRFGQGPYENWYKKERIPFVLIHTDTNNLAALVWLGPEPLLTKEGKWHTIAWRSYPLFRGKGLMKEFTKFVIDIYIKQVPKVKIWALVKKENLGSVGFAKSLGFQELQQTIDQNSLIMVK